MPGPTGDGGWMTYKTLHLADDISLIFEPGVASFLRCNIWHVRGRDFDLVIDTGMGLSPLKDWVMRESDRPIKAICTHCHFDHSGGLHEFDCRLGHRAEAEILANPRNAAVAFGSNWSEIEILDPRLHPAYHADTYRITPAPLTGYLDEGDVIDLGNRAFQVLHLPGHSPGSIGLWDPKARLLFSGDAVYDGELLDTIYHSDPTVYRQTLNRLRGLEAEVFHAGHYPSFGRARLHHLIDDYLEGRNSIPDLAAWFRAETASGNDLYKEHDWSRWLDV